MTRRRFRLNWGWMAAFGLAALTAAAIGVPLLVSFQHQRLGAELRTLDCHANFSPVRWMPILRRIDRAAIHYRTPGEFAAILDILRRLGATKHLAVNEPGLTAEQLESLLSAVRCETVYVEGAKLPRSSLPWLRQHELKFLYLGRSQFSNPAIADLPDSLETLNLTRTRISDDGLPGFVRLTKLKKLILRRTPTTQEGIERLRQQMPWCTIDWEPLKK